MVDKIERARAMLDKRGLAADLEVDGGINVDTVAAAVKAGATVLVAGSAVYNEKMSVEESISLIRAHAA